MFPRVTGLFDTFITLFPINAGPLHLSACLSLGGGVVILQFQLLSAASEEASTLSCMPTPEPKYHASTGFPPLNQVTWLVSWLTMDVALADTSCPPSTPP